VKAPEPVPVLEQAQVQDRETALLAAEPASKVPALTQKQHES
jgi:hypothetical protein